ncbi:MAG: ATP-dependent helicase [Beutenbergiaceae bacterium]
MTEPGWSAARIAEATGSPPPTAEQVAVIEAPLAPLLVVAGAGSGKTATMAARVVYLLANGVVQPGEVLGLTFTRKAAAELSERIEQRLREVRAAGGQIGIEERPTVATYNSYADSIVRDHALRVGRSPDAVHIGQAGRFQLADAIVTGWTADLDTAFKPTTLVDGITALEAELNEHGLDAQTARLGMQELAAALLAYEPAKSSDAAKAAAALSTRAQLMELVTAFVQAKSERGLIDFGEQVRVAAQVARQPEVRQSERSRYRVVLLDEYQDTSIAQVELLAALFDDGHPVTAVGDPHQAIYGWRGAAAGTLFDFPRTFAEAGSPTRTANLATAWRNDSAVLAAANVTAEPLRHTSQSVPALALKPDAQPGAVHLAFVESMNDEADAVADFIDERRQVDAAGEVPSMAVLCRRRSQFDLLAAALESRGIPVQVVGLAGLLQTPEVADIWSALIVVHDPGRGDALMRLLTGGANLGASDLLALGNWAKEQQRRHRRRADDGGPGLPEPAELASLVEAIDELPPPGWRDADARELSEPARTRLAHLASSLRTLRELSYLSLAELVTTTEHALRLDIDVAAARPGPVGQARRNLDAFTEVAARFGADAHDATLGAFLAWLDAALVEERGLDTTEPEPDPAAVQLMTIHAAKGLEWDIVVVPGMVEGTFPSIAASKNGQRRASGWLTGTASLPYDLRGDRDHLPGFDPGAATSKKELAALIADFKIREGARELAEERRLAYVAFTRARHELLLLGSYWRDGKGLATPSLFLTELIDAGVIAGPHPRGSAHTSNPGHDHSRSARWPRSPELATQRYHDLRQLDPDRSAETARWWQDAQLLLAERDAQRQDQARAPSHLSASAVVALGRDPQEFRRNQRRPIPRQPSRAARRGTQFHAWVEQHFGAHALLDADELPGAQDADIDTDPDLQHLIEAFLASPWATRVPIRVEVEVDTPMAGLAVRCRIDAVFADGPGKFHVVDWKTGPPPADPEQAQVRALQLGLYRIAWARLAGVEPECVRASFHYVGHNLTVEAPELDLATIDGVVASLRPDSTSA